MWSGVGRLVAVVVVAAGVLVAPPAAFAQQALSVSPGSGPPGTSVTGTGPRLPKAESRAPRTLPRPGTVVGSPTPTRESLLRVTAP
jgi:hypothetical protein